MARGTNQGYLQGFKFRASINSGIQNLIFNFQTAGRGQAGFSAIDMPELNLDAGAKYREGHWELWPVKVPGLPGDMQATFRRGVVLKDTNFYNWFMAAVGRSRSYKADVIVTQPVIDGESELGFEYVLADCFPSRLKPPSFDGLGNDISIWELTVEVSRPEIRVKKG